MSALGHKQTSPRQSAMSALPPLGDEAQEVAVSQRSLASMTRRVKRGLTREEGLGLRQAHPIDAGRSRTPSPHRRGKTRLRS